MKIVATDEFKEDFTRLGLGHWTESRFPWWQERVLWPLERIWNRLTDIPRNIQAFWERGTRGYADRDCWDLNGYLSSWLPDALKTMNDERKGGGNGYPGYGAANTPEKWNKIVNDMAAGFKADFKLGDEMIDWTSPRGKKLASIREKGMKLFIKWYNCLWD